MRTILVGLVLIFLVAACGRTPLPAVPAPQANPIVDAINGGPDCVVIDNCTYDRDGFVSSPVYDCQSTTYQAADNNPNIPTADFQGKGCIVTMQDFQPGYCPIPGFQGQGYPCMVQGPGPVSTP